MTATALVFQNTQFDVIDRNGQHWLRSPQIAEALGYSQANRVADTYNRHSDEFTASMTALVKLQDLNPQSAEAGQMREVRIFSLRGCHLLAMLSRTQIAKTFRVWVLDILDKETGQTEAKLKQGVSPADVADVAMRSMIGKQFLMTVCEMPDGRTFHSIQPVLNHSFIVCMKDIPELLARHGMAIVQKDALDALTRFTR